MTRVPEIAVAIRLAQRSDLDAINAVVEAAVSSWARTSHQRRAALPDCRYQTADLDRCMLLLAMGSQGHILGVAACSFAASIDTPSANPLRIDGPYVHPDHHAERIGEQIVAEACALARRQGRDCLLVEPQVRDNQFLRAMGMPPPAATETLPHDAGYLQRLA